LLDVATANRLFHRQLAHKLAKFVMAWVLDTGVDFFVFDMLISVAGLEKGVTVPAFKKVAFLFDLLNDYGLNRLWTFDGEAERSRTGQELLRFVIITLSCLLVNLGTTWLLMNSTTPLFGLSQVRWDNVTAVAPTASNFVWIFAGYKLFVFISP
jgi:putative flippase GtrA